VTSERYTVFHYNIYNKREREREGGRQGEREGERERERWREGEREKERERKRERKRGREREKEREGGGGERERERTMIKQLAGQTHGQMDRHETRPVRCTLTYLAQLLPHRLIYSIRREGGAVDRAHLTQSSQKSVL